MFHALTIQFDDSIQFENSTQCDDSIQFDDSIQQVAYRNDSLCGSSAINRLSRPTVVFFAVSRLAVLGNLPRSVNTALCAVNAT